MNTNIWLSIEDVSLLTGEIPETVRRKCKREEYISKFVKQGRFKIYSVLLTSLPQVFQEEYLRFSLNKAEHKKEKNLIEYADAPIWARKQADKYMELLDLTGGMSHSKIEEFVKKWNKQHPDDKTCYTSIYNAKIKYEKYGLAGLISQKGQRNRKSIVVEDYYEYYKSLYLREGGPSANFCWLTTLGYAKEKDNIDPLKFPSCRTFDRYLKSKVPEQAVYLARHGHSAWYKKYAKYIPRDYADIKAGTFWVSDHAQIDVAVSYKGKTCFPWVTVFRDIKTSKWLGWFLHPEAPNSDHIFQAFYYATIRFGLPEDVYLDNGKDYRSKDFAGGRPNKKDSSIDSVKENSLMKNVGVTVHFALPYNAQTKPIERDFLKVKNYLSKGFVGYRGGKITERPEKLLDEINSNKIMKFDDFKVLFDDFIKNFLNKKPSNGKVLQGKCPDELWAEEFTIKKVMSKDALKLFCMRTSKNVKIRRNGIYDSQLQITYWADWMYLKKGLEVFVRRDINAFQEAWVFEANTEKYLGIANAVTDTPFLSKSKIDKATYKKEFERKKREQKILKECIKTKYSPSNQEIIKNLKNSLDDSNYCSNPKINRISNTKMDQVINTEKQMKKLITKYSDSLEPQQKIYLTKAERDRDLAQKVI